MPIVLKPAKLAYYPVPKAACSSLKALFFEIENGRRFEDYHASGQLRRVHDVAYGSPAFQHKFMLQYRDYDNICVVRDPVDRVVSCYADRVVKRGELSEQHLTSWAIAQGAVPDPDFETFVDRIGLYMLFSANIHHHTAPLWHYLGPAPDFYTRIFTMADLEAMSAFIRERTGSQVRLGRDNPADRTGVTPTSKDVDRIRRAYQVDYALFAAWLR